jgi:tetratricopeptide (TPR) repeat protein
VFVLALALIKNKAAEFNMKLSKKWKLWIIRIFVFVLIPVLLFVLLYFTSNIELLYNKAKEKYQSLTVLSIAIYLFVFIGDILKDWISNYISDFIFPKTDKQILGNTEEIIKQGEISNEKINEVLKNVEYDPRELGKWLKKLPPTASIEQQKETINGWYEDGSIDEKLEKTLLIVISYKKKTIDELNQLIKNSNNDDYTEALMNIKIYLEKNNASRILDNYYQYKKEQKEKEINVLKQSIKAILQLFAYEDTKELFNELINLEPTSENYFDFAFFLQKYNYINEALEKYQEALKIYRELAKENPRTYLPDVAMTLNNLANLHS